MLDDLKCLIKIFKSSPDLFNPPPGFEPPLRTVYNGRPITPHDKMYCPSCGDFRRMRITLLYWPGIYQNQSLKQSQDILEQLIPSLFTFVCVQCETRFTVVIYQGPDGPALAVLPSCHGGLRTPHTPPGVAFYLDQAQRAQSVGANSAAIAMFRGALEHLLFEQGYKTGTLGFKIKQLCEDIKKGSAPKWALELETEFLEVIKDLGNGSIHPNDGDVAKQAVLDNKLLALVKETFRILLFLIYEVPYKKNEMLTELRAKAEILKK